MKQRASSRSTMCDTLSRIVVIGIGPVRGALSPCPGRSGMMTRYFFKRAGTTGANVPAWSFTPCSRTIVLSGAPAPSPVCAAAGGAPPIQYTTPSTSRRSIPAVASESRAIWMYAAAGSTASKEPPVARHAERGRGLVVSDARPDHHHEIARLDLLLGDGVVERHRDARRSGVAHRLHDRVRLLDRQPEVIHHQLDRRLADLREDDEVDAGDVE